jgi:class 3 adenylate cyclase
MSSQLLDKIHNNQNRTVNAKVVFTDIVSYSKRRSQTQAEVVDGFMRLLKLALDNTASEFIKYIQTNGINFDTDVIRIPSGDGAAIVFPFDGLHDVHLRFALNLLKEIQEFNNKGSCDKFNEQCWCNCHPFFKITVGITEGKVVLYKDLNGNYNIAGNSINIAARIMRMAEPNQIMFAEDAYRQIIDMVDDSTLDERFIAFKDTPIKHGVKINVHQYIDKRLSYLNSTPNESLLALQRMFGVRDKMKSLGMPLPPMDTGDFKIDLNAAISLMEGFAKLLEGSRKTDVTKDILVTNLLPPTIRKGEFKVKSQKKGGKRKQ